MEIRSFPNNIDEYIGAEEVMHWLHGRTSGVFGAGNNCAVAAVQGAMAVTVSDGTGWLANSEGNGVAWWNNTEKITGAKISLAVSAADGVLNRIDRVIVEWETVGYTKNPEIKILRGSPRSNAAPPALTNNNTLRQISLAKIAVNAGTTSITSAMITDERLDSAVCGIVLDRVEIDTSVMQSQFDTLLNAIRMELEQLEAGTAVELKKITADNTVVDVSAFVSDPDSTSEDYPIRAAIPISGVRETMIPEVVFNIAEATSCDFAPVCKCYDGGIYIYTASTPDASITIPTIIVWR